MAGKRMTTAQATDPGSRGVTTEWAYGYRSNLGPRGWHYVACDSREEVEEELKDLLDNRGIGGSDVQIYSRQRLVEVSEWFLR